MPSKNLSPVSFNIFIDLPSSCMKIQLNNYLSQKKNKNKNTAKQHFSVDKGFQCQLPFGCICRSYELMERILKVYVYKDGEKPIFHQPILKGLYASEGWFMKLMERNKRFVVKDPRQAQLFYMPFSSRMLEYKLYVRNSHNRTNLRQYLKQYSEKIAAKYRFWNRTGGSDHFLVACHDWVCFLHIFLFGHFSLTGF